MGLEVGTYRLQRHCLTMSHSHDRALGIENAHVADRNFTGIRVVRNRLRYQEVVVFEAVQFRALLPCDCVLESEVVEVKMVLVIDEFIRGRVENADPRESGGAVGVMPLVSYSLDVHRFVNEHVFTIFPNVGSVCLW